MVFVAKAQYTRYIVKLKDKKSSFTLANPTAYLSPKAIARRAKSRTAIDSTDLPIVPAYVAAIQAVPNVTILNQSKWLNQILIKTTDPTAMTTILQLPFVQNTAPVAAVPNPLGTNPSLEKFRNLEGTPITNQLQAPLQIMASNSFNYGNSYNQIHLQEGEYLHNLGFTGKGITIAILDAGFLNYKTNSGFDSVRLQNRVLGEWDYVMNEQSVNEDNFHGANCFSIISGNRPGSYVGSAPHANFYLLRTEDAATEYPVEEQNWVAAAEYADSVGADMISSSLGYVDFNDASFNHSYLQRDGNTAMITIGADLAAKKGILVCNSAGNNGNLTTDFKYVSCPADGDSVLTVGATNVAGLIAGFSSYGPNGAGKIKPDISSVGWGTYLINSSGNVVTGNGTSYSNPLAAGLIASLWQAFPELSNMEIIDAVKRSSNKYSNPDIRYGSGIPNFRLALLDLMVRNTTHQSSIKDCYAQVNWSIKDDTSSRYIVERKLPAEEQFTPIHNFRSSSLNFQQQQYTYKDTLGFPGIGAVHYRVKLITEKDSTIELFSSIHQISIPCIDKNKILITPNPVYNATYVILNTPEITDQLEVVVTDLQGRKVFQFTGKKTQEYFSLPVQTQQWKPGIYILQVYMNHKRMSEKKLVKL